MNQPLREIRRKLGVSQMRVAQAAGRSLGWAQQAEAGVLVPSREDAEKVADLLDTDAETLFGKIREPAQ